MLRMKVADSAERQGESMAMQSDDRFIRREK
jgi:hypothetical protein